MAQNLLTYNDFSMTRFRKFMLPVLCFKSLIISGLLHFNPAKSGLQNARWYK